MESSSDSTDSASSKSSTSYSNIDSEESLHSEYLWGIKCILKGLDFLHSTCSSIHGNLSLNSIFVTPNGDWKLGSLELLCNMKNENELNNFLQYSTSILDKDYQSNERLDLISSSKSNDLKKTNDILNNLLSTSNPPGYIDTYSLSIIIKKLYNLKNHLSNSNNLYSNHNLTIDSLYNQLNNTNYNKRNQLNIKIMLKNDLFNNNLYINLMESLNDFNIIENYSNILTLLFNKIFYSNSDDNNNLAISHTNLIFNDNYYNILETNSNIISKNLKNLSKFICNFKIFPILNMIGSKLISDYQTNRQLKDTVRNYINFLMLIYAALCKYKKIFVSNFVNSFSSNIYLKLWGINDRNIRLILLKTLKYFVSNDEIKEEAQLSSSSSSSSASSLVSSISSSLFSSSSSTSTSSTSTANSSISYLTEPFINNELFFLYLNGFNDTNLKIKETSLLNIIYLIKKLNTKNINDNLIKILLNLQNDVEVSIRTNTIILISKIIKYFNEYNMNKYLAQFFLKSIKDSFIPCRLAGLKSIQVSLNLLNFNEFALKILPQIIILSIDNYQEIREISINIIEVSLDLIKKNHVTLNIKEKEQKLQNEKNNINNTNVPTSSSSSSTSSDYWSSWGGTVLQGISKAIDIPTPPTPTHSNNPSNNTYSTSSATNFSSPYSNTNNNSLPYKGASLNSQRTTSNESLASLSNNSSLFSSNIKKTENVDSKPVKSMKWDSDDDFNFDDDNDDSKYKKVNLQSTNNNKNLPPAPKPTPVKKFSKFDDDDFDFDIDDDDDKYNKKPSTISSTAPSSSSSISNLSSNSAIFNSSSSLNKNEPTPKSTPVKKFSKFDDDDFDFEDDDSPKNTIKKEIYNNPNNFSSNNLTNSMNSLSISTSTTTSQSSFSSNNNLSSLSLKTEKPNSNVSSPKAKPAIKKLEFTKDEDDGWDDF